MANSLDTSQIAIITGGVGSGKSTVSEIFSELGADVICADVLAKEVVQDKKILAEIISEFGAEITTPSGELDRKKLAAIVFSDPSKRKKLEAITHPAIRSLAHERFQQSLKRNSPLTIYDCPLFFESAVAESKWKSIILVYADEKTRLARVTKQQRLSTEDFQNRLKSQLPLEDKKQHSDFVIENNASIEKTRKQCALIYNKLKRT